MSQFNKPEISFTDADVRAALTPDRLRDGWYLFVIRAAECGQFEKSGHLTINTRVHPLTDPEDIGSQHKVSIRDSWCMPFANPTVNGHTKPNTFGIIQARILAIYDEIPLPPRKEKGKKTFLFNGEQIDAETARVEQLKIGSLVAEKMIALWNDPTDLLERCYYGLVAVDDQGYQNVKVWARSLPDDATMVPADQFIEPKDG